MGVDRHPQGFPWPADTRSRPLRKPPVRRTPERSLPQCHLRSGRHPQPRHRRDRSPGCWHPRPWRRSPRGRQRRVRRPPAATRGRARSPARRAARWRARADRRSRARGRDRARSSGGGRPPRRARHGADASSARQREHSSRWASTRRCSSGPSSASTKSSRRWVVQAQGTESWRWVIVGASLGAACGHGVAELCRCLRRDRCARRSRGVGSLRCRGARRRWRAPAGRPAMARSRSTASRGDFWDPAGSTGGASAIDTTRERRRPSDRHLSSTTLVVRRCIQEVKSTVAPERADLAPGADKGFLGHLVGLVCGFPVKRRQSAKTRPRL